MNVPDVILVFDKDMRVEYANVAFGKLTRRRTRDFMGKSLEEMGPEFKNQWEVFFKELLNRPKNELEPTTAERRERVVPSREARDPLAPKKPFPKSGKPPPVLNLGDHVFTFQLFDVGEGEDGVQRTGVLLTELKEEKKLLDQLTQAENISGLDTLAAGLAHEINNPLFAITGYAEGIASSAEGEKVKKYAEKIKTITKRLAALIVEFSGYSHHREDEKPETLVDLNHFIDTALEIATKNYQGSDLELSRCYESGIQLKILYGDLLQILMNVIKNSVQAMEGKGKLILTTERKDEAVRITIQDNGPGIPEDYLSLVFNPFFTTKEQGEGTGLGLNVTRRLAEKYKGRIEIQSQEGQGTTVIMQFPENQE